VKDLLDEGEVARRIYQSRPDLVLNIGNEYMTRNLMGDLAKYYTHTALNAPKRHFLTRFVRDLKEDALKEIDFCHYTVPLNTSNHNGFVFPGDYMGQYGVYEAVKHVYNANASLKHLVHEDYLLTN